MSLRLWRKKKRIYHPQGSFGKKINPWYTSSLTTKQKKLFARSQKMYSSELGLSFPLATLYQKKGQFSAFLGEKSMSLQNKQNSQTKEKFSFLGSFSTAQSLFLEKKSGGEFSISIWKALFNSDFWMFSHPIAVAGTVRVRKGRKAYADRQHALHNLNIWLHRTGFRWSVRTFQSLFWARNAKEMLVSLESAWPLLLCKGGYAVSIGEAKQILRHHHLSVNENKVGESWTSAIPGDVFSLAFSTWVAKKTYKPFYQSIIWSKKLALLTLFPAEKETLTVKKLLENFFILFL